MSIYEYVYIYIYIYYIYIYIYYTCDNALLLCAIGAWDARAGAGERSFLEGTKGLGFRV